MSTIVEKLTAADLDDFPNDGKRYEIIDGELTVSPSPGKDHQGLVARLVRLIGNDVEDRGIGRVYAGPVDVLLSEHDRVQPDVLVLLKERNTSIYRGNKVYGAPDVVIEIISPSSRAYDSVAKFLLYERNGVPEYWLIDPDQRTIRQFVLVKSVFTERNIEDSIRSAAVPGLVISTAKLFAVLDE